MMYQWQQTMKDAISEVMETMFFLPVDFESEGEQHPPYWCRSTISMTHMHHPERRCEITFYFMEPCARTIAANFLAKTEDEVTREEIEDTLKEVANMVGGSFLFNSKLDEYQLSIPRFQWLQEGQELPDGIERVAFHSLGEPGGAITYFCTINTLC